MFLFEGIPIFRNMFSLFFRKDFGCPAATGTPMEIKKIGIIGLGLIGGTLAKTIHRTHPSVILVACDPNEASLSQALSEGCIQEAYASPEEAFDSFRQCRYLFLCAPVQENNTLLAKLSPLLGPDCILSDVGSVKSPVHELLRKMGLSSFFIGGHPMTGSEKSGYENSKDFLLENAHFIVTADECVEKNLVEEYCAFVKSIGAVPLLMTPADHDYATAAVSHLPHIIAAALVNLVQEKDNEAQDMKAISAGGFKDLTRIASSSPSLWQEICQENQESLLLLMDAFQESMEKIRRKISEEQSGEIRDFFQTAKDYRDSLLIPTGKRMAPVYEIFCDLVDEVGGLATITTSLATNAISIKNISITHNREFEEGALHLEFYDEESLQRAIHVLRHRHYTVYEREPRYDKKLVP